MDGRRGTQRGRRPAMAAALLAVCAFGSAPALAQLPVGPDVTVPVPITDGTEPSSPESTTTTTTTSTTTSTAPPPTTPTTEAVPVPAPVTATTNPPSATATENPRRGGTSAGRRAAARARTAPAGEETFDVSPAAAEDEPTIARLRQVSLPAARQFGFPLGLAALVLLFLAVQGRLDARDPKLAAAPLSVDDDLLPFA